MKKLKYKFRIVGSCREQRRLVDAEVAFRAYAECDERAELNREAYLSAFNFGEDFREHLKETGSTAGFTGICGADWLWFDIDHPEDLEAARLAAEKLCITLCERYFIVKDELLVFFSGSKGFHIGLPTALWLPEPSTIFHKITRRMAENIAAAAEVEIDFSIYDRVRAFRAPNSRHPKTGLYKRWLSVWELTRFGTDKILKMAETATVFDIPEPTHRSGPAATDWLRASGELKQQAESAQQSRINNGSARLNRLTLEFIRAGAKVGDRHRLLFSAAANLAEFDCPRPLAHALLTEAALDSRLPPREINRQIECGLDSLKKGEASA